MKKSLLLLIFTTFLAGCSTIPGQLNLSNLVKKLDNTSRKEESKVIEQPKVSTLDCAKKDMEHCAYVATVEVYSLLKNCPILMHQKNPKYTAKNVASDKVKFEAALKKWDVYKLENKHIKQAFDPENPYVKNTDIKIMNILQKSSHNEIVYSCKAMRSILVNDSSLKDSAINSIAKTPLPKNWIKNFK